MRVNLVRPTQKLPATLSSASELRYEPDGARLCAHGAFIGSTTPVPQHHRWC